MADNTGKKVAVHYRGTLDSGEKFDSSYDRGEPLEFTVGAHQMIPGFDAAVKDMELGEKKSVHLEPKDAYGEHMDDYVRTMPLPCGTHKDDIALGSRVMMQFTDGSGAPATIIGVTDDSVTVDLNHELAGKALNFDIELVKVY